MHVHCVSVCCVLCVVPWQGVLLRAPVIKLSVCVFIGFSSPVHNTVLCKYSPLVQLPTGAWFTSGGVMQRYDTVLFVCVGVVW